MSEARYRRAKAIFLSALELGRDERPAYLGQVCGSDAELRAEVDSLLEHSDTQTSEFGVLFKEVAGVGHELLRERFEPGARIADRYVVIRRLGAGGMGEVYLARDERLQVEVALKFLPRAMAEDRRSMERLLAEARLARGITHPGVCRIHDVGESEGEPFLTMEYIEGFDLSAFLKREGSLSRAEVRRMAAELCSAIAAAHQQGVLHGDLKPGNVLVDREGHLHIADFGLAGPMGRARSEGPEAGSPAYMAPELLAGEAPSVQSDLFSLGLVVYELAARRRAFESPQAIQVAAIARAAPPSPGPSADPVVERVVRRSLSPDPRDRPRSAAALEEALWEADDLRAVLLLGELPSPELVAFSGARGLLGPRSAWKWFALLAALLALLVPLAARTRPVQRAAPELPPAAFAERSAALLDALAGEGSFPEVASAYQGGEILPPHELEGERFRLHETRERGVQLSFWYRRARGSLTPQRIVTLFYLGGTTQPDDPPLLLPGSQMVVLDLAERLVLFVDVPGPGDGLEQGAPTELDWSPFFARAGLDPAEFEELSTGLPVPSVADRRGSWRRPSDGERSPELRVEAGSLGGRPVLFGVFEGEPRGASAWRAARRAELSGFIYDGLLIAVIGFAIVAGWRHLRSGRGDPWGALRLAVFVLVMRVWEWAQRASHTRDVTEETTLLIAGLSGGLFEALLAWGCYMGVEPYVRRHWPRVLVSWSRLLRGRLRDPLVASHVLIGATVGLVLSIAGSLDSALSGRLGSGAESVVPPSALQALTGLGGGLATIPADAVSALGNALVLLATLVLARLVLRRNLPALGLAIGVIGTVDVLAAGDPRVAWLTVGLAQVGLGYAVLVGLGVLPYAVALFVAYLLEDFPITPAVGAWYGSAALFVLPLVLGLGAWALSVLHRGRRGLPGAV